MDDAWENDPIRAGGSAEASLLGPEDPIYSGLPHFVFKNARPRSTSDGSEVESLREQQQPQEETPEEE